MRFMERGVAIVAPFFLYLKQAKWADTFAIITYIVVISYAIFTLFFLVYSTGREVQENTKRLKELQISVENYQLSIKNLNDTIESYKSENSALKITISSNENVVQKPDPINPDLMILAQLIESEAGNQSFQGKLAVGTVVLNRVDSNQFPNTIKDVIFQKGQFSPVSNGKIANNPSADSLEAAKEILDGVRTLAPNILYFYNPKLVKSTNWIKGRKVSVVIGNHAFAL